MKIKILTTGGTIDKVYFDEKSRFEVGDSEVGEVLERSEVTFDFSVETLFRRDSLELTDEDRQTIRNAIAGDTDHDRFLVTHGTDTMVQTAKALQGLAGRVIVLTGSIEPSRFRKSSAVFNLGCAIGAIQTLSPGVFLSMNGRIFAVDKVRKNAEMHRFEEA